MCLTSLKVSLNVFFNTYYIEQHYSCNVPLIFGSGLFGVFEVKILLLTLLIAKDGTVNASQDGTRPILSNLRKLNVEKFNN